MQEDAGKRISNLDGKIFEIIRLGSGVLLYFTVLVFQLAPWMEMGLFLCSYGLIGGEVVYKAVRNLFRGRVFDENMLMTIATLGAFAVREYPEAVAVMLFYQVGELFQDFAVDRSRGSIQALLAIRPDYANVRREGQLVCVNPEEVTIGEEIVIKPGERVPLDGKIVEGNSLVDTAPLTGEALPRRLGEGDSILSGCVNTTGLLVVEVLKTYGESTVAKILDLVQNAESRKAPTEHFITKFARYYTPIVVGVALALAILPPLFVSGAVFSTWLYRGLIFLVISCPCALVISIPLSFFGGIGAAARKGILVKGGNYLEALHKVDTVIFDKTGTMTKGAFQVGTVNPVNGYTAEEVLSWAAQAESFSTHPIAQSIVVAANSMVAALTEREPDAKVDSYEEIAGLGVRAVFGDRTILVGNSKLMQNEAVQGFQDGEPGTGTVIHVAVDNCYIGSMVIADQLKEDSVEALRKMRKLGVRQLVMLTGDNKDAAAQVAARLQVDDFQAELLPQDKVAHLERLYVNKGQGSLIFLGDGINDAPVLARADVGVAMGGLGSDAAIEAADVVIMTDEPSKLATAIQIAGQTKQVVWQNIILALTVKGVVLALGAAGFATMWQAVFADVGVALLAVFNAMRVLRI
jgi:Cd2+/Zn2+-exporting ATPase